MWIALAIVLHAVLAAAAVAGGDGFVRQDGHLLFAASALVTIWLGTRSRDALAYFFAPGSLSVLYVDLTFAIGSLAYREGMVLNTADVGAYARWELLHWVTAFFLVANGTILLVQELATSSRAANISAPLRLKADPAVLTSGLLLLAVGTALRIGADAAPAVLTTVPTLLGAAAVSYGIRSESVSRRLLVYTMLLGVFAALFYQDKRVVVSLFILVAFLEAVAGSIGRVTIKHALLGSVAVAVLAVSIIVMSITRGYGNYGVENPVVAALYLRDYVGEEQFARYFFNNIEVSYSYFHSVNAVEVASREPEVRTWGATLARALFVVTPSSIVSKPPSILDSYTARYDRARRREGKSSPVVVQSEMYWNFGVAGLGVLAVLYYIAQALYLRLVNLVRRSQSGAGVVASLAAYACFPFYVRGSGLDIFVMYAIAAAVLAAGAYFAGHVLHGSLLTEQD